MNDAAKQRSTTSTSLIGKKRTRFLYIFIISLTVIVLAVVYFLIPDILGDKESVSPQIRQMSKLTARIGKLETDLKSKGDEFFNLLKEYYQQTGETLPSFSTLDFSEGQKRILEERIKNQQDVSIKELLNDILDKKDEIAKIETTIKKYEVLLPRPHIAKKGENHYQIAMDFLVNDKKVPTKKAIWLVERTALFDPLISGFKVWNFYSGDEYGTFVTQGDAPISPNELRRQAKNELTSSRYLSLDLKNGLEDEIKKLELRRYELNSQIIDLQNEKVKLRKLNQKLFKENSDMEKRLKTLNTLYIIIDLEKKLIKSDILKSVFLGSPKLRDIPEKYFKHKIDLREKNAIEISARQFKLYKIKRITLYPKKYYKENIDYKVEIDANRKTAKLTILKRENFKNSRIVISVE